MKLPKTKTQTKLEEAEKIIKEQTRSISDQNEELKYFMREANLHNATIRNLREDLRITRRLACSGWALLTILAIGVALKY